MAKDGWILNIKVKHVLLMKMAVLLLEAIKLLGFDGLARVMAKPMLQFLIRRCILFELEK